MKSQPSSSVGRKKVTPAMYYYSVSKLITGLTPLLPCNSSDPFQMVSAHISGPNISITSSGSLYPPLLRQVLQQNSMLPIIMLIIIYCNDLYQSMSFLQIIRLMRSTAVLVLVTTVFPGSRIVPTLLPIYNTLKCVLLYEYVE